MSSLLRPLLATLLLLSGCKLIDQTTFAPSPSRNPSLLPPGAPASPPVARVDTRTPLVVIDQNTPVSAYDSVIKAAVQAAEARDPGVNFDVTVVVPAQGNPAAALTREQTQAAAVMQAVSNAGIPDDRVHLRAAADPNLRASQLRLYVG